MGILEQNINKIHDICSHHHVKNLYVFGSILTKKFTTKSDVDFAVDFQPMDIIQYADNYFNLKISLQEILNRNIDLIEIHAIKNPHFKKSLELSQMKIYGIGN